MMKLDDKTYDYYLNKNVSISHFMGGCSGPKELGVILIVKNDTYYFTADEVGNEEYRNIVKQQNQEAEDYISLHANINFGKFKKG